MAKKAQPAKQPVREQAKQKASLPKYQTMTVSSVDGRLTWQQLEDSLATVFEAVPLSKRKQVHAFEAAVEVCAKTAFSAITLLDDIRAYFLAPAGTVQHGRRDELLADMASFLPPPPVAAPAPVADSPAPAPEEAVQG